MHNINSLYQKLNKLTDAISIIISFYIAWFIKFKSGLFAPTWHLNIENYMLIIAFFIPLYFFVGAITNITTKKSEFPNLIVEIFRALRINTFAILLVVVILYAIRAMDFSRIFMLIFVIINLIMTLFLRYFLRAIIFSSNKRIIKEENILFIGQNKATEELAEKFKTKYPHFNVIGFVDLKKKETLGEINNLEDIIRKVHIDEIIISLPIEEYKKLEYIINICEKYGIRTYIIPDYLKYIPAHAQIEQIEGIPLINVRYSPLDEWTNRFIKRTFDICVSLLGLILCLPIFLVVAILIKLTSKGPIIFTQERVGYNRKVFKMHKFRTMRVQAPDEEKNKWTTKDDPRRTPIGKILRKLSIDELPQLWDVFIGNMSLVGPRPERPYFVEKFKEEIPKYMVKHRVRPGITGWAQVNGLRGDTSIEERIRYDIYYIENWSFSFDIKIILATIFGGKFLENAY